MLKAAPRSFKRAKPRAKPGKNRVQFHVQNQVKTQVKPREVYTPYTPRVLSPSKRSGGALKEARSYAPSGKYHQQTTQRAWPCEG